MFLIKNVFLRKMNKSNFIFECKVKENFCFELDWDFVMLKRRMLIWVGKKQLPAFTLSTFSLVQFCIFAHHCASTSHDSRNHSVDPWAWVFIYALHTFIELISKVLYIYKKKFSPLLHLFNPRYQATVSRGSSGPGFDESFHQFDLKSFK